jgi:hypothetical protein
VNGAFDVLSLNHCDFITADAVRPLRQHSRKEDCTMWVAGLIAIVGLAYLAVRHKRKTSKAAASH